MFFLIYLAALTVGFGAAAGGCFLNGAIGWGVAAAAMGVTSLLAFVGCWVDGMDWAEA